jgi:hypothetical protein
MDDLERRMNRVIDAAREGMTPSAANTERTRRMLLAATAGLAVGVGAGTASAATAATTAGATGTSAAGAGVATAGKGAGLFAALSSLSLGTKVVTAVAVSATIGTAGLLATQVHPTTPKPVAPIAAPAQSDAFKAEAVAAPVVTPPVVQPEVVEPAPEPEPAPAVKSKAVTPGSEKREAVTPDPLSAELVLIERARQALKSDNPQQALTALNEHGARFQNGVMAQERRALHALALCSLGDPRGNQEAQRFIEQNPGSPLASHLRTGCK